MHRFIIALLSTVSLVGLVGAAQAADLVLDTPVPEVAADTSGDWDGIYAGIFAGSLWGEATSPVDFDLSGYLLGLNLGANFTLQEGLVVGVVGDLAWSNATDEEVFLPPSGFDIDWVGSVRGRVGFDGGAFMPYLTAGVAFANGVLYDNVGDEVDSNTHFGWTAGLGVEFKATEDVSLDLAYRYSDYGAQSYGVTDWEFTTHQVTAGVNWRF